MQNDVRGFNLLGMVVILAFLAIFIYFIAPHFRGNSKQNLDKIKQDITAINEALGQYKLDNGFYPSTEQGLDALVNQPTTSPVPQYWDQKGYISTLPVDPWGQNYQYTNSEDVIRVFSYGKGGKQGAAEIDLSNINS